MTSESIPGIKQQPTCPSDNVTTKRTYPNTPYCSGEILERFECCVRDSDVFISTSAKCGQTWLLSLLYHLKTRGKCPDLGGKGLHDVTPWLEIPADFDRSSQPIVVDDRLKEFEDMPDPRVFKLHLVWEEIPRPADNGNKAKGKVICIFRDVREVPYSMYEHHKALREGLGMFASGVVPPFENFFQSWVSKSIFYFKHLKSMWPHRNDDDVLFLQYEQLKANTTDEARRVVDFLGWDISRDDIQKAVELASFDNMKKAEKETYFPGDTFQKDKSFIRQGSIGENRQRLSKDMENQLRQAARDSGLTDEMIRFAFYQDL